MKNPLLSRQRTPNTVNAHQAVQIASSQPQSGLIHLQHLIGNQAINRLLGGFSSSPSLSGRSRLARKPAGVNMALRGRGRVTGMSDDDITLKLTGAVGSGKAKNAPEDVRLVQQKLRQLDYLSTEGFAAESPAPNAANNIPASQLPQTIMAIRAFQRHTQLTSDTDGRIDVGGLTNKLLDVEDQGVENTAKRAADEITSLFESGGDYGEIFLKDYGVVSYGKHQATLAAGTLYTLLKQFVTDYHEKSDYARRLEAYLPRVKNKDESLADDGAFISLLKDAGRSDPCMQTAQDDFFDQHYGGQARKKMGTAGVTSALAYAFFYDSQIHGGIDYDLDHTIEALGGTVGQKGGDGSIITEDAFMKEMTKQRQERNARVGQKQLEKAKKKREEADVLEAAGKTDEARAKRAQAAKDEKNGTALTHSANDPKGRLGMWRDWANKGDLDLSGDSNGMLMVKGTPVLGLRAGATLRGTGSQPVTPGANPSTPAANTPAPAANTPAASSPAPAAEQSQSSPGVMGSLFGRQSVFAQAEHMLDFFTKARNINLKYARNPPLPGWPYRRELKALWDSGSYNEFAMKVLKLQTDLMGLSPNDKDADGILGKMTARAILNASQSEFLIEGANTDDEIEMDPVDVSTPTQGGQPTAAAPATGGPDATPETDHAAPTTSASDSETPASAPTPATASAASVKSIIEPLKSLYQTYEGANLKQRRSYAVFYHIDNKIATLRWNIIRLKFLSNKDKLNGIEQAELKRLQASDKKKPLPEQLEAAQAEREAMPIDEKRNPASAVESFRKKNPDRIKAERALVTAIAAARQQIASLADADLRAAAYIELNKYTPYHYQMENMDVLYNGDAAGGRTCNVTTVSMVLEALGKNPGDYKGKDGSGFNAERMKAIATVFDTALKDRGETVDSTEMRMPDFMQLVAIDHSLKDNEATLENISSARWAAADNILKWEFLRGILKSFGTKYDTRTHPQSDIILAFGGITAEAGNLLDNEAVTKDKGVKATDSQRDTGQKYASAVTLMDTPLKTLQGLKPDIPAADLKTLITAAIDSIKVIRTTSAKDKTVKTDVFDKILGSLRNALDAFSPKKLTDDQKRDQALKRLKQVETMAKTYSSGGSLDAMQTVLSVEDYKSSFLTDVTKAMKQGHQVVVGLHNHFERLQSVENDGFVMDDPGRHTNEGMHISWAKAISAGYFQSYMIVKP